MSTVEVSKLAQARGCVLKVLHADDVPLYWVENHVFIGKPFRCLEELVQFILVLPLVAQWA